MNDIKYRLKLLRDYLSLTQKDMSQALMIKQSSYSAIETGRRDLTERNIALLCNIYSVNPDWLKEGTGEMFVEVDGEERQSLVNALQKTTGYNREWIETGMGEMLPIHLLYIKKLI